MTSKLRHYLKMPRAVDAGRESSGLFGGHFLGRPLSGRRRGLKLVNGLQLLSVILRVACDLSLGQAVDP